MPNKKLFKFLVFFTLLTLATVGAACAKKSTTTNTNQANGTSASAESISVLGGSNNAVQISAAVLNKNGFVVIYKSNNVGNFGTSIGVSALLSAGKSENFVVATENLIPGDKYWALLHHDNGDGLFDPTYDVPTKNAAAEIIMTSFIIPIGGLSSSTTGVTKEYAITAKKFSFSPNEITANVGDRVILTITSTDVLHGFYLADYGIIKALEPNQPVTIDFIADRAGTFPYFNQIYSGEGQASMIGKLIVK